jgi:hypothetical protein
MLDDAARTRLLDERESIVKDFESYTDMGFIQTAVDEREVLCQRREGLAASLRSGY